MSNVTQHHSEFQSGAGHISQMSNLKEKNPKSNPEPYKVRGCPEPFSGSGQNPKSQTFRISTLRLFLNSKFQIFPRSELFV